MERGALGAPANGTPDLLPAFSCSAFLSLSTIHGERPALSSPEISIAIAIDGDWQLICSSQRLLTQYQRCKND